MKIALTALVLALASWSCSGIAESSENVQTLPQGNANFNSTIHFEDDTPEGKLKQAHYQVQKGEYSKAIHLFEDVLDSAKVSKQREEALYYLADTHMHLLNPFKDLKKALYYIDRLIAEYPNSDLRAQADEKKRVIHQLENMGKTE